MSVTSIPDMEAPPATYLTQVLAVLRERRAAAVKKHEEEIRDLDAAIVRAGRERELVLRGLRLDEIRVAQRVLEVRQPENAGVGDGPKELRRAVDDLAAGAPHLRRYYIGTKDYDRWHGQAEGGSYGTGPRHGHTIFCIGLTAEARGRDLTPYETEAAIRYLLALEKGPLPVPA